MPAPVDPFEARMALPGNRYQAGAAGNILALGLGSAGLFAALRGLRGLADTYAGSHAPPPKLPVRRQVIAVPVPRRDKEAAGPLAALAADCARLKRADAAAPAAVPAAAAGPARDWLTNAGGRVVDFFGGLKDPDGKNWGPVKDTWWNYGVKPLREKPWLTWAAPLAIAGGGYAGYKATDALLGAARRRETDSELAAAKAQYERALLPPGPGEKAAAAPHPLDAAFDALTTKRAGLPDGTGLNPLAGGYALAATLLAGGAGLGAYRWARAHHEDDAVADALRQRRERLFAQGPPALVAVPEESDPAAPPRSGLAGLRARLALSGPPKQADTAAAADATLARFTRQRQQLAQQTAAMLGVTPGGKAPARPAPQPAPPPPPSVVNPAPAPAP